LIVKLNAVDKFSAFGKVFKVTNIKTKEIKMLKAITIINNSFRKIQDWNENTKEIPVFSFAFKVKSIFDI
jgi:hypothetical protein